MTNLICFDEHKSLSLNNGLGQFHTMAGGSKSPASSLEDGKAYVNAVKVALEEAEPAKYQEFLRLFHEVIARRCVWFALKQSKEQRHMWELILMLFLSL